MIDLETLGTDLNSVVLSIGAVKFDTNAPVDQMGDRLYVRVDPVDCQRRGLVMDAATVMWWFRPQQELGRKTLLDEVGRAVELDSAIDGFFKWWASGELPTGVWSNGATFDIMIMRNLFRMCQMRCPWAYYEERCFRTLKNLLPGVTMAPAAHHALADAVAQASHVQLLVKQLGLKL